MDKPNGIFFVLAPLLVPNHGIYNSPRTKELVPTGRSGGGGDLSLLGHPLHPHPPPPQPRPSPSTLTQTLPDVSSLCAGVMRVGRSAPEVDLVMGGASVSGTAGDIKGVIELPAEVGEG